MAAAQSPKIDRELDRRFMAAALRIGRHNLGRTYPNPAVGTVLVRDGQVVGRGWTAPGGRPHAETEALSHAAGAARGATAYVTLEPCAHEGRTPPCADALIAAGVARVVTPLVDPDPRVSGEGIARLEAAGIAVTVGVLAEEAARAHAGHISRVTRGRPYVVLKLAVSADGMIGRREGERMNISGKAAFDTVQAMRAESDAVMIGIGTVLVDNPRLTVRLPGLENRSPVRIVLDAEARLPLDSLLVASARDVPLIAIVAPSASDVYKAALRDSGVRLLEVGEGPGGIDLSQAFAALAVEGFTRILVEGGSEVASTLVAEDLVDEVVLFRADVVVGPDGVRALGGYALSAVERSPRYRQIEAAICWRRPNAALSQGRVMFTGIITDIGSVIGVTDRNDVKRIAIATTYAAPTIDIGASVACAGVCLTVIAREETGGGKSVIEFEAGPETLATTTVGDWDVATRVNLERALKIGDELGGHMMSGHVDGLATIVGRDDYGETTRFVFEAPPGLARFVAAKGSVGLDGTSLTVNAVDGNRFECMLIPHTLKVTTWNERKVGDRINLEVDTIARYVARLMQAPAAEPVG